jgi:hypothetical protein
MQHPAKIGGAGEKSLGKEVAPLWSAEIQLFTLSAGRHHVGTRIEEPVLRSIRPVHSRPLECGGMTPFLGVRGRVRALIDATRRGF